MHLKPKFRSRSAAAQSLREPPCRLVENRNGRPRAACSGVKFLERHHATLTKASHHFAQTCRRIVLVHEYEPANDRVKRLVELHRSGIAYFESYVGKFASNYCCSCSLHGGRRPIDAENVSLRTDQIGSQETYVSASATDIEHAHSRC